MSEDRAEGERTVPLTMLELEQLGHQFLGRPSLNVSRSIKNVLNVEVGGEKLYRIAQLLVVL